jgi:hypothetical protein
MAHGVETPQPFPDFFLAGAPRCGTTLLTNLLRSHPQVCFSATKETHYFITSQFREDQADLKRHYVDRYFSHYDPERHRAVGEGSVTYIYFPEAIDRILELNPQARFIVMVRNPLEMVTSYHHRMLYILEENVKDFEKAWDLQEERARGRRIPRRCLSARLLQYADIGSLGKHVEALLARAPREHCHFVVHDEVKRDLVKVYGDTLDFLGLGPHVPPEKFLKVRLPSRGYRYRWLQQLIYKPPGPVLKLAGQGDLRKAKSISAIKRARKRLMMYNKDTSSKPKPLGARMRGRLCDAFADDVAKLGRLLERDLSHWLEG